MEKGSNAPPPVLPETLPQCHLSLAIEAEVRAVQKQWLLAPKPASVYVATPLVATPTHGLFESAVNSPLPSVSATPMALTPAPSSASLLPSSAVPMETSTATAEDPDVIPLSSESLENGHVDVVVKSEPDAVEVAAVAAVAAAPIVNGGSGAVLSRENSIFLRSCSAGGADGSGGGVAQGVVGSTAAGAEAVSSTTMTPLKRSTSLDEICLDVCRPVYVRVVDQVLDKCEVKPNMRAHYPDCITEFPYVRKVILAFINLDDKPMCFFGYVII